MASPSFAPAYASRKRISLAAIDAAVSARLGPTRGLETRSQLVSIDKLQCTSPERGSLDDNDHWPFLRRS
jgi:hypothetical protein